MSKDREKVGLKTLAYGFVYEHAILKRADIITYGSPLIWPEGFNQEFTDAISQGYVPVIISNHQSWYDGLPIERVARRLRSLSRQTNNEIPEFLLTIAASLADGNQGDRLQRMYQITDEYLKERNIKMLPFVREKDKEKYGITGNNFASTKELIKGIKEGKGIAVFPEGSVEGGRKNIQGGVNGMQHFEEDTIANIIEILKKLGKKAIFIPVGISGSYDVLDPNTKKPTWETIAALYRLGFPDIVSINVGASIRADDLEKLSRDELNSRLGQKIACLLPYEERGVFKEVTIYQS